MATDDASQQPALSIIIPAFNEAHRLPKSLRQIHEWLAQQPYTAEVIVVDDGSTDDTATVVRAAMTDWPTLSLHMAPHHGKGATVRAGALVARGALVAFADADLSMPVGELDPLRALAQEIAGVAIASREAPGSRRYGEPWYRHAMGRVFNRLVQLTILPGIQDTQCGFKCMPREVALALCAQQTISGWGFDVELLAIARCHGFTIREMPIPWYYMANSRVRLLRDTVNMFRDVLTIRANLNRGRYNPPTIEATTASNQVTEMRNIHAS